MSEQVLAAVKAALSSLDKVIRVWGGLRQGQFADYHRHYFSSGGVGGGVCKNPLRGVAVKNPDTNLPLKMGRTRGVPMGSIKGIIFDMDNTILQSNIDFGMMKAEVFGYLAANGVIPHDFPTHQHTTGSLINHVQRDGQITEPMQTEIWDIATKHEVAGMEDAKLEPGVKSLLDQLKNRCNMVILTNNSYSAAISALKRNNIDRYFEHIIAREQMEHIKPAPDGIHVILNLYRQFSPSEWLSVGDAWIDGKAAQEAGVTFISYRGDIAKMHSMGVFPAGSINHIGELVTFLS